MVELILRFPRQLAIGNVLICLILGLLLESIYGLNLLERFGALSVGASVFLFGFVVADLINRGQGMDFARLPKLGENITMEEKKKLGGLRSWSNVSLTLNSQAYALLVGTVQASLGSIILGVVKNANP